MSNATPSTGGDSSSDILVRLRLQPLDMPRQAIDVRKQSAFVEAVTVQRILQRLSFRPWNSNSDEVLARIEV